MHHKRNLISRVNAVVLLDSIVQLEYLQKLRLHFRTEDSTRNFEQKFLHTKQISISGAD